MKCGVLGFSYGGFTHFATQVENDGFYSSNLGDNAQTIASRKAWRQVGADDDDIITIDRDSLKVYSGEAVLLLMNAVFGVKDLPASEAIAPLFLGFCADDQTIAVHQDWLRKHQPIGCRDVRTADICTKHNIESFVTGCVTITLPRRSMAPATGKTFIVLGGHGLLPLQVLSFMPPELLATAEIIFHRKIEGEFPLGSEAQRLNERYEEHLLARYVQEAQLVVTPLLHVASPCTALGVPIILCRQHSDPRFSFMQSLMPVYGPDSLKEINWAPTPPDVRPIASAYLCRLSQALEKS